MIHRILPFFMLIIAFSLGLGAYMSYEAVRSSFLGTLSQRMQTVGDQIATAIRSSQSFGIELEEQTTLPALLQREAVAVRYLKRIDVVTAHGEVLYSSQPEQVGRSPEGDARWTVETGLSNDLGETIGSVVVRMDALAAQATIRQLAGDLALRSLPIVLAALLLAGLGLLLILRALKRRAEHLAPPSEPLRAARPQVQELEDTYRRAAAELDGGRT
ncbi:hypothetical protein [Fodinicurvata fenggangensis]|uniref:hypothetical protein n=1 Tax=Fodinicurvata fenggangensis TaxID=1121830 RepID=UPI00047C07FD|nr:hypothetical protein [Fodinicurvata fenggangensis]